MKNTFLVCLALCTGIILRAGDNGSIPSVAVPSNPAAMTMGTVSSYGSWAFAARDNITGTVCMDCKSAVALSYTMWNTAGEPRHLPSVAASFKCRNWGFAMSADTYIDGRAYTVYDDNGTENGTCLPYNARFSFGTAYAFGRGFSAGIVANGIYSVIHPEYNAFAVSADVYAGYNSRYASAVLAVTNLGTPVRYYGGAPASHMPVLIKAGVNIRPAKGLQTGIEGNYMLNNSSWMFNAGAQYTIMEIATVRAGYHYGTAASGGAGAAVLPSYASAGIGFRLRGLCIEASYLFASPVLDDTISVALSCRF